MLLNVAVSGKIKGACHLCHSIIAIVLTSQDSYIVEGEGHDLAMSWRSTNKCQAGRSSCLKK